METLAVRAFDLHVEGVANVHPRPSSPDDPSPATGSATVHTISANRVTPGRIWLRTCGGVMLVMYLAPLLAWGVRNLVHTLDSGLSLTIICGGAALITIAYASFREHVVTVRTVRALRDPARREDAVRLLRQRVSRSMAERDIRTREDAIRDALESLILADCWDEVSWFVTQTGEHHRPRFLRWVKGVSALASLQEGDIEAATAALDSVGVEGSWLASIDALRLALAGEGQAALTRLGDTPKKRPNPAVLHQRWLARVHALAAVGRREEAVELLTERLDYLASALRPEGPATPLAVSLIRGEGGPFRTVH